MILSVNTFCVKLVNFITDCKCLENVRTYSDVFLRFFTNRDIILLKEGDHMDKKKMFGLRIKTMRQSRKMTQADLAKLINQSQSSITMYETGRREPDFETLEALADVFNVPLSSLMDDNSFAWSPVPYTVSTSEARIISSGIDKLSKEQREQALAVFKAMFASHPELFEEK